jgi:hypothetical protein
VRGALPFPVADAELLAVSLSLSVSVSFHISLGHSLSFSDGIILTDPEHLCEPVGCLPPPVVFCARRVGRGVERIQPWRSLHVAGLQLRRHSDLKRVDLGA